MAVNSKESVDILPSFFQLLIITFSAVYAVIIIVYSVYNDALMKGINNMILPLLSVAIFNSLFHNAKSFLLIEKYRYVVAGVLYAESFLCCDSSTFIVLVVVLVCLELHRLTYNFLYEMRVLLAFVIACEFFAVIFLKLEVSYEGRVFEFISSYKLDLIVACVVIMYILSTRFRDIIQNFFSKFKVELDDKQQMIVIISIFVLVILLVRMFSQNLIYKQVLNSGLTCNISGEELVRMAVDVKDFSVGEDGSLIAMSDDPWIIIDLDDIQGMDKSDIKNMMFDIEDIYSYGENIQIYYIEDLYNVDTYIAQQETLLRGKNVIQVPECISKSEYIRLDLLNVKGRRIQLAGLTFNYHEFDYLWCDVIIGVGAVLLMYNVLDMSILKVIKDKLHDFKYN